MLNKCSQKREDVFFQVLMEPWAYSYYFSADRLSERFEDKPDIPGTSFRETKATIEGPHPGEFACNHC